MYLFLLLEIKIAIYPGSLYYSVLLTEAIRSLSGDGWQHSSAGKLNGQFDSVLTNFV